MSDLEPLRKEPPMRLGFVSGQFGPQLKIPFDLIAEAEKLGFDAVWTAEAYGNDAVVPLSYIAARTTKIHVGTAIMQMPARTPAMTAMTAMSVRFTNRSLAIAASVSPDARSA